MSSYVVWEELLEVLLYRSYVPKLCERMGIVSGQDLGGLPGHGMSALMSRASMKGSRNPHGTAVGLRSPQLPKSLELLKALKSCDEAVAPCKACEKALVRIMARWSRRSWWEHLERCRLRRIGLLRLKTW